MFYTRSVRQLRDATELFEAVFSVGFVPRCYKQDNQWELVWVSTGEISADEWSKLVGELLKGPMRFSPCELLLSEVGSWGSGTVREPRARRTPAVGSRYQTTTGEDSRLRRLSACCSELQSVRIRDSAIVTCSYVLQSSTNPITNPNPV
jgi:hypothetical protein